MRHLAARADRGQDDRRKNQDEKREVVPWAARPGGHPAARRRSRTAAAIETVPAAGGLARSTAVPVRAAGSPSSRQGHRAPVGGQLPDPWRAIRGGGTPRGTNARWRRAGARRGARWPPRFRGLFHPHPNGQRPESGRHADQGGVQPSVRGPTSNASGSTIDGIRGGTAISAAKCRRPATTLPATGRRPAGQVSHEQPPRGRLARLFEAADRRHVPLRTILVTVAVVVAAYLAGQLIYRLRDIVLLMLVAGFTAMLLNPVVAQRAAAGPAPGPRRDDRHALRRAGLHRPGRGVRRAAGQRDHPPGAPDARLRRQRTARQRLDRPPRGPVPRPELGAAEHA